WRGASASRFFISDDDSASVALCAAMPIALRRRSLRAPTVNQIVNTGATIVGDDGVPNKIPPFHGLDRNNSRFS
ncbi:MAG TPA: hypothetical protein VK281_10845, partial [Xanthobacteraceae bacterium]|nr:hypothetical protein [Xanthobacteraceae bacterium]